MKKNSKNIKKKQERIVTAVVEYGLRRYNSQQRMRIFEEEEVRMKFESLENDYKVQLLKDLWDCCDYPARQLSEVGYDALSMLETYSEPVGNGDSSKNLYRIYLSDKELDEDVYYEYGNCHGLELSGSWFRSLDDAQGFLDELSDSYYGFRWNGSFPKYAYRIDVPADSVKICWEGDTGRGKEVVVNGFDEDAEFYICCVGTRRKKSEAA